MVFVGTSASVSAHNKIIKSSMSLSVEASQAQGRIEQPNHRDTGPFSICDFRSQQIDSSRDGWLTTRRVG
jgi:hypothetical protein